MADFRKYLCYAGRCLLIGELFLGIYSGFDELARISE